jgi:hypothetical protein
MVSGDMSRYLSLSPRSQISPLVLQRIIAQQQHIHIHSALRQHDDSIKLSLHVYIHQYMMLINAVPRNVKPIIGKYVVTSVKSP